MTYQNTFHPNDIEAKAIQSVDMPKDINQALKLLISGLQDLHKIYKEETNVLQNVDSKSFLDMQDKKFKTAIRYEAMIREIMTRKDDIKNANPALKKQLKDAQKKFSELTTDNLKAVERMQKCTRRLGDTLRKAAIHATQNQRASSYSGNGALSNGAKHKSVSTGINETA